MDFGSRLRKLREEKDLTQLDLAERLGLTNRAIGAWESGRAKPRLDKLNQLADILGTTSAYLMDGDDPEPTPPLPTGSRRVTGRSGFVPLRVLGKTHAGAPTEEIADPARVVEVPAFVAEQHPSAFALAVEGDCMDLSYPDGCVVLVDPSMSPWVGCDVVAEVSPGESVLRRYMRGQTSLMLVAHSHAEHADLVFSDEDVEEVRLLGVVCWFQADEGVAYRF